MTGRTPIVDLLKVSAVMLTVAACDQQPQITEGTVYHKSPFTMTSANYERDPETGKLSIVEWSRHVTQSWVVYIAQCPTSGILPVEKILRECKTNSFSVPIEVYQELRVGQHAELKRFK